MVAVAFILATSVVEAVAPSSRSNALGELRASTTSTVTRYQTARQFAITSCAISWATSTVRILDGGSCAKALVERAAKTVAETANVVSFMACMLVLYCAFRAFGGGRSVNFLFPISITDVTKVYSGGVEALRGISLDCAAGRITALLGRSGCGKTTLLNLCGAMDFPTTGEVSLAGEFTSKLGDAGLTQLRRHK